MIKGETYQKTGTITQTDEDGNIVHTEEGIVIGRGDNKRVISKTIVKDMAASHCELGEMADMLGVKPDTLKRHFADSIAKGKAEAKHSLRRAQWKLALSGNATMQIWLGKNILGQTDSPLDDDAGTILPWTD